jgi:hypothetical protein
MKTKTFEHKELIPSEWRATYVLRPDMAVLVQSLHTYGWLSPLIVRQQTMEIIDGYHRWLAIRNDPKLMKKLGHSIPVILVKCDLPQAMLMHLQLNRGRGATLGAGTSKIVRDIIKSRRYKKEDVRHMLGMSTDEIDLMVDATLLKQRNVPAHQYSKAWVPIEAPATVTEEALIVERPPNADR